MLQLTTRFNKAAARSRRNKPAPLVRPRAVGEIEEMEELTPKLIPEISVPDTLKNELMLIQDAMMTTWKKQPEWDFTCGYMPRPELDAISDLYWETFGLITGINEVIEHLNLVILELSSLVEYPELWRLKAKGRIRSKYTLMVRTFFYELFRAKEIHNKYLKYLVKKKLLRKPDIQEYKDDFAIVFEDFIEIRNKMVHGNFAIPGKDYMFLWMTEFASENSFAIGSKETGEIITTAKALKETFKEFEAIAQPVGAALTAYFERFSHGCCTIIALIKEGKVSWSGDHEVSAERQPSARPA